MAEHVLITGGAGYLGRRLATQLIQRGLRVSLHVRARGAVELAARRAALIAEESLLHACTMFGGDLTRPRALDGCDASDITHIVHAAAITRFDVSAADATAVNVEGTAQVLEFARRCRYLESLLVLSSLYSSGLRAGPLPEDWQSRPIGFANQYERSKLEAEALCAEARADVPLRLLRVATVCADSPTGEVVQRGALHHALELVFAGLLAVLPGKASTPLFLIDQSYASRAAEAVLLRGADGTVYHAAHSADAAPSLGALIKLGLAHARPGVLAPPYVDLDAFEDLRTGAAGFAGPLLRAALDGVSPFAPQLFVHKQPATARLEALLGRAGDPQALAAATVQHLAARRRAQLAGGAA